MAIHNQLIVDVYLFDSTGNKFRKKETRSIPLPAQFLPVPVGASPDPSVFVYGKILYGPNYSLEAYTGQTPSALDTLANA